MNNDKIDNTVSDIIHILEIAKRFHNIKDHNEGHILDRLFILDPALDETNGNIIIGARGHEIISNIATRHIPSSFHKKIAISHLSDLFRHNIFVKFIVQGREINRVNTKSIIDNSVNELLKMETKMIHFIPFNFFSNFNGGNFSYGELTIHSISNFEFANEIESKGESCLDYYGQFNAIAEIPVYGIDYDFTLYKAKRILDSFLGICRLIPGASSLPLTTRPNASYNTLTYSLFSSDKSKFNFKKKIRFHTLHLDGWEQILLKTNDTFFDIMKLALSKSLNNTCNNLATRIIDSLITFHNALDEDDSHFRLVKLVSVVERLYSTNTKDEETLTCVHCKKNNKIKTHKVNKRIKQRSMDLLKLVDNNPDTTIKKLVNYYGTRSDIVHGSLSLISDVLPIDTDELTEIVSNLIMASALFYYKNRMFDLTSDCDLDELYFKLKEHNEGNNISAS